MTDPVAGPMEVVRLAGAPGVGKSTTAWRVAAVAAARGTACGYVDIDQLGMCYPAPDDDPDRWRLKERVLARIVRVHAQAAVRRLVVSGVAWPDDPPAALPGARLLSWWLDASEGERRRRLSARGLRSADVERALGAGSDEAQRLHPGWARIDTDGRTSDEVVAEVIAQLDDGPGHVVSESIGEREVGSATPPASVHPVLWITGPRLAGASDVGWSVVSERWRAGERTGFADLRELSFAWNAPRDVGAASLAALLAEFDDVGATASVVVAPLEVAPDAARAALPAAVVRFVRLDVSEEDIRRHAALRRRGGGAILAGDDLRGADDALTDRIVRAGTAQRRWPLRDGETLVDTTGLGVADARTALARATGW